MGRLPCSDENGLKKGPWSPEEDQKLIQYIQKHGHGSWRALPKNAGLNRCGKSCRLRWTNYLRPDIKRGKFSDDEEQTILNLHSILGNKWSAIATHLPGRTDNEIKNFWNTHLKKKLIQMGFDPMTHRPRTELYSNLPHLMALANLSEIMAYHRQQQQQYQHHQQHLHQPPLEEYAVGFQSEAAQFARHQYLQCLLQSAVEAVTSNSSNANNTTDTEAINMLALPSSAIPNGVDEETVAWDSLNFDNTNSSLGPGPSNSTTTHQLFVPTQSNLQLSSNFQELKDPTMNSECNQGSSFLDLLHQEESILKSRLMPPIIRAGSFNQPENYVTNQVDVLNNSGCGASSFLPELFFEEPFIYEIA